MNLKTTNIGAQYMERCGRKYHGKGNQLKYCDVCGVAAI